LNVQSKNADGGIIHVKVINLFGLLPYEFPLCNKVRNKKRHDYTCNRLWRPIGLYTSRITNVPDNWPIDGREVVSFIRRQPLAQEEFCYSLSRFQGRSGARNVVGNLPHDLLT
jgi:hypothetical protein